MRIQSALALLITASLGIVPAAEARPPAAVSNAIPAAVNERGQIVGVAYDDRGGSRGFLLERGAFTLFDGTRDAAYTRALDINNRGQIVGDYAVLPPARD